MVWYAAFALMMIGPILPGALLWQRIVLRKADDQHQTWVRDCVRTQRWALAAAWCVAVTVLGGWFALASTADTTLFRPNLAVIAAFHLIWWPFVMPFANGLEAAMKEAGLLPATQGAPTVRTATLRPRQLGDYLPAWAQWLPLVVMLTGISALTIRMSQHAMPDTRELMEIGALAMGAVAVYVAQGMWTRSEVERSLPGLPVVEPGSTLDCAVQQWRRTRVATFHVIMTLIAVMLWVMCVAHVETWHHPASATVFSLIGAIFGTGIGVLGGIAGTWCSYRMKQVQMLAAEMERSGT